MDTRQGLKIDKGNIRCLVLGGCGFLGSHLVDSLVEKGYRVTIFDKFKVDKQNIAHNLEKITLIEGDFANKEDIYRAMTGVDYVFHFIGTTLPNTSTQNPIYDLESNVISSVNLLEIAKIKNIRKIVFASSGGTIYGIGKSIPINEEHPTDPISAYGISKLVIEKYLHLYLILYGINYISLRISNAYGERQNPDSSQGAIGVFLGRILNNDPIDIWGNGEVIRDYIYVKDVVEAAIKAAEANQIEKRVLNIGSGIGTSLRELVALLAEVLGRDILINYRDRRKIDVPVNILDNSLAKRILGWEPRTCLSDGIKRVIKHLAHVKYSK